MNPNTMTAQEAADWCAKDDGWREAFRHRHASGVEQWCWERDGGDESFDHPHPLTLDGAAAALPEGWKLFALKDVGVHSGWSSAAIALPPLVVMTRFGHGPDELTARYRLAVACRMAAKEQA